MKRLIAMLLALVMTLSLIPATALMAFAEEDTLALEEGVNLPEEPTEAPAEEPTEAPAEEPTEAPAEEPTDAPVEEPTKEPAEKPAKKNAVEYCGYEGTHIAGVINGYDCSVAEDGSLIVCSCNFPDANFGSYIGDNVDLDSNGLLDADELTVGEINCREREIASLQGVEYFAELEMLDCGYNALTELDVSNNPELFDLYCDENQLTELDVSVNTELEILSCYDNQLTELDVSNNTQLTSLDCGDNALTELDVSVNTELEELSCYDNQLTELDVSNNTQLTSLVCGYNALTELDVSNNPELFYLYCDENQLTELDVSVNTELEELECGNNALTELDVSNNTQLTSLGCSGNQLTELDVSNNPELFDLYCDDNQLTELDVSNNTKLTSLGCSGNQLTELDVSVNTELEGLSCYDTQLTELDVSNNPELVYLYCGDNALTELDVSVNTELEILSCYDNQLTELDVSNNTKLTTLDCESNQLTELDVSNNTQLKHLECGYNALTELDVSNNPELFDLYCDDNQLTELDVSNNTKLTSLGCSGNQLTELDVSVNTELEELECSYNALTELDVSNNTKLIYLDCSNNSLTKLDLSDCTDLEAVQCHDQYWYGELPVSINEEGWYNVDLSGITDVGNIDHIITEGGCDLYPSEDIVSFENDPSNGFSYEYMTGWGDHVMTVNINVSRDDNDDENEYIVLPIPALEDMIQLYLDQEAVIQWTQEDCDNDSLKWFYFIPEEDMEITFLTTVDTDAEEHVDPMAYWTDAEGNVVTHNDDYNGLNSAIYVEAVAGETYYFAVKSINAGTGPLPVVIMEGNHIDGGSGGDNDGDNVDFSEIAPALEDMTVLELDTDFTATIENAGDYAWFTFTPAEDGTYTFFSTRDGGVDPFAHLLDADLQIIGSNDDDAGDLNFSLTGELEAGQTYVLVAKVLGADVGSYTVRVVASEEITDISVKPISLPEYSWCAYNFVMTDEGVEVNPYYFWHELMEVTLTFADGSTATGTGTSIIHNGIPYRVRTSDDQDYAIAPWTAGNTYDVEVYIADGEVTTETTVKITSSQIKSVSFDDITVMENTCGRWYAEEEVDWFIYDWDEALKWTVTFKDGKKLSGTDRVFKYKDNYYQIGYYDNQHAGAPWTAGNTYTGYAYVGGIRKSVDVTIRGTTEDLAQVQNLRVTSFGETSVKIKFDKVEGAGRYEIYVNGGYWGNTTSTSYTISGLTLGDDYQIAVAAAKKVDGKWVCGPVSDWCWGSPRRNISDYYVSREYSSAVYDGTAKYPKITLKKTSSSKAIDPKFYDVFYGNNMEVGQGLLIITGQGEYGGMIYKDIKILPQQVTGVKVTEVTSNSVTITFDPVHGATEYWVYRGSTRVAKITDTTYTFTGLSAGTTYKFSVKANAVVEEYDLSDYDPYEYEAPERRNVNYTGAASATVSAKPVYRMENCTVQVKYNVREYTGKSVTNTFTVKNASGKTLKKDTDYTVSYQNNKEMGIATATLKGKGKYAGQIAATFVIGPKAVKDVDVDAIDGTSLHVSYDKVKGAYGYIIFVDGEVYNLTTDDEYIIEGLTAGQKYSITVRAVVELEGGSLIPGVESKAVTATPRHDIEDCNIVLSSETFYYTGKYQRPTVQVYFEGQLLTENVDYTLSFKNNKNTGRAYVEVTGKGAYNGSTKAYYTINPAQVTGLKVSSTTKTSVKISYKTASSNSTKYYNVYVNGECKGRTTGSSYTIKNLELGKIYSVYIIPEKTVSGTTYYGDASEAIDVWPGTGIGSYYVKLEYTTATYTGEAMYPSVVLKTSSKSTATVLVEGEDYTVTYENNVGPGKAKVIIQGKEGSAYTGTITKTVTINPPKVTNVTATAVSTSKIEVSFDAAPGATSYWVYVNGDRKAKITDTTCVITGLSKNKTYKITVKAVASVDGTSYTSSATDAVSCKTLSK